MNDVRAALALQEVPDVGPATAKKLIDHCGSPAAVFSCGKEPLMKVEGLGAKRAEELLRYEGSERAGEIERSCGERGIRIIPYGTEDYPVLLRQISDPPTVLYVKGNIAEADKYSVALVGSRASTPYGKSIAQYLSEGLAAMGLTVVSGMARGIDSVAHVGAIRRGGRTLAVLGSGIEVIYPAESRDLYERIQGSGAVVSEFPLGTPPNRENFPRRNRVISGLSLGVVVIEAAKGSGTLITAKYALDQGREVFAVPGNINAFNSQGTNELLKSGAKLITGPEDVLRELGPVLKGFIKADREAVVAMTREEKEVCDILSAEPVHIDEITRRTGYASSRVLGLLLGLELKSVVRQMDGKKFFLVQEAPRA